MTRTEYLLTCLAEECAEVAQRCSKALRFGLDEVQPRQDLSNADRIALELADVMAVLEMLNEDDELIQYPQNMPVEIKAKKVKIERYMQYSFELGILNKEPT